MTTTIQKWGNSQGIRIPKYILESIKWNENEEINIITKDNKIIIEKAKNRKNIMELFANYNEQYQPTKIDWGNPMGKEIW